MRLLSLQMPEEMVEVLRTRAFETRTTMSELIRVAVATALDVAYVPNKVRRGAPAAQKAEPDEVARFMATARKHQATDPESV